MTTNKYPGRCPGCGAHVGSGEGFLEGRTVWCSEPKGPTLYAVEGHQVLVQESACETSQLRTARTRVKAMAARASYVLDPAEVAARAAQSAERAAQDSAWAAQGLKRCGRCDGRRGRKEWPGFVCFGCDGHGTVDLVGVSS